MNTNKVAKGQIWIDNNNDIVIVLCDNPVLIASVEKCKEQYYIPSDNISSTNDIYFTITDTMYVIHVNDIYHTVEDDLLKYLCVVHDNILQSINTILLKVFKINIPTPQQIYPPWVQHDFRGYANNFKTEITTNSDVKIPEPPDNK